MRIALFQPEIPQNTGTILRLAACMNMGVDVIEPCGFIWNHAEFKRAVMDYIHHVDVRRFADFEEFQGAPEPQHCVEDPSSRSLPLPLPSPLRRIIPCIVGGRTPYTDFDFSKHDTILFGRESDGIPPHLIHGMPTIYIPMPGKLRSLNLAIAAAMVAGEASRQRER